MRVPETEHPPDRGEPHFVVETELEIAGSAEQIWAVLADFDRYREWNPYVLAIEGALESGSTLRVTIAQANWPEPLVVEPTVVRAEQAHVLHWRGQVGEGGILDTDHVFEIQPQRAGRVLFRQFEEFRGSLAEGLEEQAQSFTRDAFQAMNEAVALQVQAR